MTFSSYCGEAMTYFIDDIIVAAQGSAFDFFSTMASLSTKREQLQI